MLISKFRVLVSITQSIYLTQGVCLDPLKWYQSQGARDRGIKQGLVFRKWKKIRN